MATTETVKTLEFLGAILLAGGFGFALLVWLPAGRCWPITTPVAGGWPGRTLRWGAGLGAGALILFGFLGLLGLARAAAAQPLAAAGWDFVAAVAEGTRYGRMTLVRMGLAGGALVLLAVPFRHPDPYQPRGVPLHILLLGPTALAVLATFSLSSHAAATLGRGPWPLAADLAHLLAVALWAGGLAFLSLLPWRALASGAAGQQLLHRVTGRFATLSLAAVAVLTVSGLYLSSVRVYSPRALVETDYGASLLAKLVLLAGLLTAAAANRFWLLPALRRGNPPAGRTVGWLQGLIVAEAVLALTAVSFAADLTVRSPVADPPVRLYLTLTDAGLQPAEVTVPLGRRVRLQVENPAREPGRLILRDFEHRLEQGPGLIPHRELLVFAPPTDKLWVDVAPRRRTVIEFTPLRAGTFALERGNTHGGAAAAPVPAGWIRVAAGPAP